MSQVYIERSYYPNGQLWWEGSFKDGKLHGKNRHWHENGRLSRETSFEEGLENGNGKQWNKEGELLGEYWMDHGTGVEKSWYENGQLERESSSIRGKLCGRFRCWCEDGKLVSKSYYIMDKKVSKMKYEEACRADKNLPRYKTDDPELEHSGLAGGYKKGTASVQEQERHNELIRGFLKRHNRGEARQWLAGDKGRSLGEMTHEGSIEFVEGIYKVGATKVIAVEIENETTNCLIVELSPSGSNRQSVFEWNSEIAQGNGFDPDDDWGQNELLIYLS